MPENPQSPEVTTKEHALEFLRSEAVTLQPRKVEADLALSYLHNKQTFFNDKLATLTTTGRFGLISGMEGFVQIPVSWGERRVQTFAGENKNQSTGVGDLRFGLKYSVIPESYGVPNVVASLSASAPTCEAPYAKPLAGQTGRDTRNPLLVPLGMGHWSVTGGLTALKFYDPLTLFAGVGYTHFFEETYHGVKVQPGDVYELNSGLGFLVNENSTISGQVIAANQNEWRFNNTYINESGSSPISLRFAYTQFLSARHLVEPSILFGVTRDANDAVMSLGYSYTF